MSTTANIPKSLPDRPTPGAVRGHWSLTDNPHLLRALEFSFVNGDCQFDPCSDWTLSFDLLFCGPQNFKLDHWVYQGWMEIHRAVRNEQNTTLQVLQQHMIGPDPALEWQRIETTGVFHNDVLATIPDNEPWTIASATLGQPDPQARTYARVRERSVLEATTGGERIWRRSIGASLSWEKSIPSSIPATSTPGLLDAVQRLPEFSEKSHAFGIFRQAASWCPDQILKPIGTSRLEINGESIQLRGWAQTGDAHLPTFFWLNEYSQLVIIRHGVLALVHNPDPVMKAQCPHEA